MGLKSRNKGKIGEREVARIFRAHGYDAMRGVQYSGGPDSPDVVVHGLPIPVHLEIKRAETFNVYKAYDQAVGDSGPGEMPTVLHRKNNKEWLAVVSLNDFMHMLKMIQEG